MKLSDGEKLILYLLCDIKERLNIKTELDTDFLKNAIENNHLWGITWKYPGIPLQEEELPKEVVEVLNILEMWTSIEYSFSQLSNEDKQSLEKVAYPFGTNPKFNGFDGNNESEYLSIANFLINELDRFIDFKGRYLNSHIPVLNPYTRMYKKYAEFKKKYPFTQQIPFDNLTEILKEQARQ